MKSASLRQHLSKRQSLTRPIWRPFVALVGVLLVTSVGLGADPKPAAAPASPSAAPKAPATATKAPAAPAGKTPALPTAVSSSAKETSAKIDPLDWPMWRGPEQNGISRETGLIDRWELSEGPDSNVLWKNDELGGISTPIIMRGKLYNLVRHLPGTSKEAEKVICVDAATGKKLWENVFNIFLSDVPAERVGWSSCVGDPTTGRVFAMGVCGFLQCLDGETGKTLWSRSLNEEFGLLSTYGGRTNVPVVFEDLVITSAVTTGWGEVARPAHRLLAFNKETGQLVWQNGTKPLPEDTTYSTPFLCNLAGQAAMVFGSGDGAVWAFQPRTGKPIWNFQLSRRGLNVTPLVDGDYVYMGHAEENTDNTTMGGVFKIDGRGAGDISTSGKVWQAAGMVGKSSPLVVDGRVYACDDGAKIYVYDSQTGEEICKPVKMIGTIMRGSPVYADGKIFACTTSAWHVYTPTKQGLKLTHKLRLSEEEEVSGSPIISHGRIYLPTGARMYCLGKADQKPAADKQPEKLPEDKLTDMQPAQVQILPAEVLLQPGEKQLFVAWLYNAKGQKLKSSAATFTLEGPGEISDGEYTAANTANHTGTIITAKVGELSGQARVRVVPPLPWKFNFNDITLAVPKPAPNAPAPAAPPKPEGEPPITWIGARYRHKIRDQDGEKVMVKVTTIPKGTRSQSWMGPSTLHDYTVQADVKGALTNNKLPDAGLIAQRYTLDLMGASQQLQIRSWTPQIATRFSKSVPYTWKQNTWYTLKFRAAVEDGKAVLRGKVWPRDEKEPDAWTIEATDEAPNVSGSPGLFGNANDSEVTYDNISVTPNSGT